LKAKRRLHLAVPKPLVPFTPLDLLLLFIPQHYVTWVAKNSKEFVPERIGEKERFLHAEVVVLELGS
jgi:hypothetical protein